MRRGQGVHRDGRVLDDSNTDTTTASGNQGVSQVDPVELIDLRVHRGPGGVDQRSQALGGGGALGYQLHFRGAEPGRAGMVDRGRQSWQSGRLQRAGARAQAD